MLNIPLSPTEQTLLKNLEQKTGMPSEIIARQAILGTLQNFKLNGTLSFLTTDTIEPLKRVVGGHPDNIIPFQS